MRLTTASSRFLRARASLPAVRARSSAAALPLGAAARALATCGTSGGLGRAGVVRGDVEAPAVTAVARVVARRYSIVRDTMRQMVSQTIERVITEQEMRAGVSAAAAAASGAAASSSLTHGGGASAAAGGSGTGGYALENNGDGADILDDAAKWKAIIDTPVSTSIDAVSAADLYLVPPDGAVATAAAGSASAAAAAAAARSSSSSSSSSPRPTPDLEATVSSTASAPLAPSQSSASGLSRMPLDVDMSRHPDAASVDPFALVAPQLEGLNANIRAILGIDHPVLSRVARYFFDGEAAYGSGALGAVAAGVKAGSSSSSGASGGGGKKVRAAMVLLMSEAVNTHVAGMLTAAATSSSGASGVASGGIIPPHLVSPLQARLAEITEMIHTASLLHDDVIDVADTRRGVQSVNSVFGNKLAILAGDFLLARASVCLARLRSVPVVELLSTVIEHLVKGEVMQMKTALALKSGAASRAAFDVYLRKTYYKTGSLMANSCKAIALLGRYPAPVTDAAFRYGLHVGVAFQLVDDLLDFECTSAQLGKPAMNDLRSGLATAPVLFAAQQFPALIPIMERKFEAPGDVDATLQFVHAAEGLTATRRLAVAHGQMALDALEALADSPAKTALAALVTKVLNRKQ